jgi:hypothetical protein
MSVHKGATLVVLAIVSAFVAAQPGGGAFMLPSPTGPLHVATARWVITDLNRRDPFDAGEPRRVEVVAWYRPTRRAVRLRHICVRVRTAFEALRAHSATSICSTIS